MSSTTTSGNRFGIRPGLTKDYFGAAVASKDAFFLVPCRNANMADVVASSFGLFGLVGGTVAEALAMANDSRTQRKAASVPFSSDLAELPKAITEHPEWPIVLKRGTVLVVPRSAIEQVKYSFLGRTKLKTAKCRSLLDLFILRRGRTVRFLRNAKWLV